MNLSRRDFLKSIGAVGLAAIVGKPVYTPLLEQEYHLALSLDERRLGKFIETKIYGKFPRKELTIFWHMKSGWIDACVTVVDQYNRPWSIVGYFEGLRSPEGWEFPLDKEDS